VTEHPAPDDLAATLATLARSLQHEQGASDTLAEVVRASIAMIPGAAEGSISVVLGRRRVEPRVPSADLPLQVDAVQTETGEGPCLDAIYEQRTVSVPDMATEQRWPRFAERASGLGAASMLSFQLYVSGDNLGALNLYARTPHAFTEESEHIGSLFAVHAAVAFAAERHQEQQRTAMDTRNLIGQAQGILMERHKVSAAQAFSLLVTVSQHRNVKLRAVVDELLLSGELTGPRGVI